MNRTRPEAVFLLASIMLTAATTPLRAQEHTANNELPAAIRDLGVTPAQNVSPEEAQNIRGTAGLNSSVGVIVEFGGTAVYEAAAFGVTGLVGGQDVDIVAGPRGMDLSGRGFAMIWNQPRIRGGLQTKTGVFDGAMQFTGSPTSLRIVALPGQFSAAFD